MSSMFSTDRFLRLALQPKFDIERELNELVFMAVDASHTAIKDLVGVYYGL